MRIVIFAIAIAFVCFNSQALADFTHAYNGHGADFRWSPNTVLGPTVKVAGTPADTAGSGAYAFPSNLRDSLLQATYLDGNLSNSVVNSTNTLRLEQKINQSFDSSRTQPQNMQFDIGQYAYYAFTVSTTNLYKLTFTADATFQNNTYPLFPPNYNFAGTDSVFNFYEFASGPLNPLARFSHSAGAVGNNDNVAFNTGVPVDSTSRTMAQSVLLEAGKLYQVHIFSYSYIGGSGGFSSDIQVSNSLSIAAVPEPASIATLAVASIGAWRILQKRRPKTIRA